MAIYLAEASPPFTCPPQILPQNLQKFPSLEMATLGSGLAPWCPFSIAKRDLRRVLPPPILLVAEASPEMLWFLNSNWGNMLLKAFLSFRIYTAAQCVFRALFRFIERHILVVHCSSQQTEVPNYMLTLQLEYQILQEKFSPCTNPVLVLISPSTQPLAVNQYLSLSVLQGLL